MANFNRVILAGNLVRDPELRYTPGGTAVASFTIAVNRRYRQDEELREEVSYFDIVAYGKQAETVSSYLKKGRSVLLEGRLQQRRWETQEGDRRSKIEVVASSIQFLAGRREEEEVPPKPAIPEEEDIPF